MRVTSLAATADEAEVTDMCELAAGAGTFSEITGTVEGEGVDEDEEEESEEEELVLGISFSDKNGIEIPASSNCPSLRLIQA